MLPNRLTQIDETNRADHPFLTDGDQCYYFGEYFSGKGYQGGPTNQLIFNFKCPPTKAAANPARRSHKERAIATIAAALRGVVTQAQAETATWVPIPTSKIVGHPDYDDRLVRALAKSFLGYNVDVRPLLRQTASTAADHTTGERISYDELLALLEIDQAALMAGPPGQGIVLVDDVLTTGKHFKCCVARLREAVGDIPIWGLFIARRILPNPFDDFVDLGPLP